MSYAFSNYKLQLPVTGTEAGTWGDIVNTNMGSSSSTYQGIEQAIGGKSDVTCSSATTTLVYSDTTGNQNFRSLYLNCTGSPGAAATLVVPAIQKMYVVHNGTSGGYDLTVKIGVSTGTTVPNGKTMVLYANGTDVVRTSDYFTSVDIQTLSVIQNATIGGTNIAVTGAPYAVVGTAAAITVSPPLTTAFSAGDLITANFTSGSGVNGQYAVAASPAPTTSSFTLTAAVPSGSTSGNVNFYKSFRTTNTNDFYTNGSAGTSGQVLTSQGTDRPPQWTSISTNAISQGDSNVTVTDTSTVTTGTYSRSGFLVTVTTASAHGFSTGQALSLDFTTGTATDGVYPITVTSSTQFTVNDTVSGTTAGNVSITTTGTITFVTDGVTRATVGGASGSGILKTNAYRDVTIAVASGTYARSGTTVTVTTPSAHGFTTGQSVFLTFSAGTGGTATTGTYNVSVTGNTTFTITDSASGTISAGSVGIAPGSGFGFNGDIWYGV